MRGRKATLLRIAAQTLEPENLPVENVYKDRSYAKWFPVPPHIVGTTLPRERVTYKFGQPGVMLPVYTRELAMCRRKLYREIKKNIKRFGTAGTERRAA